MIQGTRRDFFKLAGAGAAAGAALSGCGAEPMTTRPDGHKRLKMGLASYSFRKFNLDETLAMTNRLGLEYIALKSFHLPLESSAGEIRKSAAKVAESGINLYGCGVVYMKNADQVENAFEYAKAAGISVIIGVPAHELLDMVEQKVAEYDIKLAIHNHGPGDDVYPSPESIYEKIKGRDPRMGLCVDIGHTLRIGIDPGQSVRYYIDRVHDVHIKDVTAAAPEGTNVEIGRGVIDIPAFLRTLLELKYDGVVSLEYEKDADDPLPGAAESVGYCRGVLSLV